MLLNHIDTQVVSRDLSMVEQSKNGVIAYRPYFPDKLSTGVKAELSHNFKLYSKEKERRSIVFNIKNERAISQIKEYFRYVDETIEEIPKNKISEKMKKWQSNPKILEIFRSKNNINENPRMSETMECFVWVFYSHFFSQIGCIKPPANFP